MVKAADIADRVILQAILDATIAKGYAASRTDLDVALAPFPSKVILAKCRALVKRELIDGCPCGCRGDFEVLPAGHDLLADLTAKGA